MILQIFTIFFVDIFGIIEETNLFLETLFWYLKIILIFILFCIGLFTYTRWRGTFKLERVRYGEEKEQMVRPRILISYFYWFLAFGFLTNFLTYFLIWVLDPLPDKFIFNYISKIDPKYINKMKDLDKVGNPIWKMIYYVIALVSFLALLDIILSSAYIINKAGEHHKKYFVSLMGGIIVCVLFGFTTCLPLFL